MPPFFIANNQEAILAVASQHFAGTGHTRLTTFYRLPDGRWAVESARFPENMLREHASEVSNALPEGATPLQLTSTWPSVSYAGNWVPLPGNSFGRSICCGNYTFGGCAEGEVEPVDLVLRLLMNRYRTTGTCDFELVSCRGWRVTSDRYVITARSGSRVEERVLHRGGVFTADGCEAPIFELSVASRELPTGGGPVDTLGRW